MNKFVWLIAFLAGFLANKFINMICKQNMYEGADDDMTSSRQENIDKIVEYIHEDGCIPDAGKFIVGGIENNCGDDEECSTTNLRAFKNLLAVRRECLSSVHHKKFNSLKCANAIKTIHDPSNPYEADDLIALKGGINIPTADGGTFHMLAKDSENPDSDNKGMIAFKGKPDDIKEIIRKAFH